MSLGCRTIERGGCIIFRAACPASTPREPLPFLYPRFVRHTASVAGNHEEARCFADSGAIAEGTTSLADCSGDLKDAQKRSPWTRRLRGMKSQDSQILKLRRFLACLKSRQAERKARKEFEARRYQLYRAQRREVIAADYKEIDWRRIYELLFDNTSYVPEKSNDGDVKVVVPSTAVETLLYHEGDSIWSIKRRTKCKIEFPAEQKHDENTHILLLSGLPEQIAKACQELQRIVPDGSFSTNLLAPIENLPANAAVEAPSSDQERTPRKWTASTFLEQVTKWTRSNAKKSPPQSPNITNKEMHQTHAAYIRDLLSRLFGNPNFQGKISLSAVNMAMAYFVKTGQKKDARRLYVHMEMQGAPVNAETFNIMLRGCAKTKDFHNFGFIVVVMLMRGLQPDVGTWLAFLNLLTNFDVQIHVVRAMREKGLLQETWVMQTLCRELATLEAKWSIAKKQRFSEFLRHMDQRYGPHWLTVSAANRILDQFAQRGFIERCCRFAQFMTSRRVMPNDISLNSVLTHCRTTRNFLGAIHVVKVFTNLSARPDSITYNELFYMGKAQQFYSFCRVVWRYACLKNETTFAMRLAVRNSARWTELNPKHVLSAKSDTPWRNDRRAIYDGWYRTLKNKDSLTGSQVWLRTSGKVIFGDMSLPDHPAAIVDSTMSPNLKKRKMDTVGTYVNEWVHKQMALDLAVHEQWEPSESFAAMLAKAYFQDRQWKGHHVLYKKRDLRWTMQNAIKVPVVRKKVKGRGKFPKEEVVWA